MRRSSSAATPRPVGLRRRAARVQRRPTLGHPDILVGLLTRIHAAPLAKRMDAAEAAAALLPADAELLRDELAGLAWLVSMVDERGQILATAAKIDELVRLREMWNLPDADQGGQR